MIPKVKIGSKGPEICRLVCGSNAFCGISHFTQSRDLFLSDYFSDNQKISEIMVYVAQEFGVNAIISSPRDHLVKVLDMVEKESGVRYHWICSPSNIRQTSKSSEGDLEQQIKWCAEHHVTVCIPHRSWTDAHLDNELMVIRGLPEVTAKIRDAGMIPGLSTHYYESIRACEVNNYDIELIVQPVNVHGFQSNIEVNTLVELIRRTKIQILAIKPMAAGRIEPEVGLPFAFNNIKPNDFVACGFDCIHNADYDGQLVDRLLRK